MPHKLQALDLWRNVLVSSVRQAGPDLSSRQLALLLTVYLTPPPHTVRGLASTLNISKPAISRALDRLGRLGFIRRKRDDADRRNVLVQRTVKGSVFLTEFSQLLLVSQQATMAEAGALDNRHHSCHRKLPMTLSLPDPRTNPYRPDLAAAHLEGIVQAERFIEGVPCQLCAGFATVKAAPDFEARQTTQALFGETVTVYEEHDGWVWGQIETDGYVGYLRLETLSGETPEPTHRVAALRTFLFPEPDLKSPTLDVLSLTSRVAVIGETNGFAELEQGGWVFAKHLAGLAEVARTMWHCGPSDGRAVPVGRQDQHGAGLFRPRTDSACRRRHIRPARHRPASAGDR